MSRVTSNLPTATSAYNSGASLSTQSSRHQGSVQFASLVGGVASMAVSAATGGAINLGGTGIGGGLDGQMSAGNAQFEKLLSLQNAMQVQNMEWSAKSNVSKTQHEGTMNAVRNVKA